MYTTQSYYGEWFLTFLAGTKTVKSKDKTGEHYTQQLIPKKWIYPTFKDAWESAELTKKNEFASGDIYITDIRIEVYRVYPEHNGDFARLYDSFEPVIARFLNNNLQQIQDSEMWKRRIGNSESQTIKTICNYILDFCKIDLSDFKIKTPSVPFYANYLDIQHMMRCCVADQLVTRLGYGVVVGKTEAVGISIGL